jgi:hypothetical protein
MPRADAAPVMIATLPWRSMEEYLELFLLARFAMNR